MMKSTLPVNGFRKSTVKVLKTAVYGFLLLFITSPVYSNQLDRATTQQKNDAAAPSEQQQKKTIKGKVTSSENGTPIEFIAVVVKGTQDYAITNKNGEYSLSTARTDGTLTFQLVGLDPLEVPINGRSIINVQMSEKNTNIDAVVVNGYQTISKERVTGSFGIVKSDVINSQVAMDLASGLEGRIAGVVRNGNDFTIRGLSTMNAVASPLYVIDGFPVEGDSPEFAISKKAGPQMNYSPPQINPEDIESITVLKDAAAASIYGSRAANGVIVITTKKPKQGATEVFFSADMNFTPVTDYSKMNYLSANQFINLEQEFVDRYPALQDPAKRNTEIANIRKNKVSPTLNLMLDQISGKITGEDAKNQIDAYRSDGLAPYVKDYMDYIFRPKINKRYYMSVGKSVAKNNFMGSVTYNERQGKVKNFESNDLEFNLRNRIEAYKWLNIELNANVFSRNNTEHVFDPSGSGTGLSSGVGSALTSTSVTGYPYTRLVDENGNPQKLPDIYSPDMMTNYAKYASSLQNLDVILQDEQNLNIQRTNILRTRAAAKFNFVITPWLQFQTGFQYEANYSRAALLLNKESIFMRYEYDTYSTLSGTKVVNRLPYGDSYKTENLTTTNFTQRNQINFNKSFDNNKHIFTAIAGTETRQIKGETESSRVWGYDSQLLSYVAVNQVDLTDSSVTNVLSKTKQNLNTGDFNSRSESLNRFVSLFGNGAYTYDGRFDLSGSLRWDLSNLFGTNPDYQYRPFWSVGAAWNLDREDFLRDVDWLNRLKMRATYGINGNIAKTVSPYLIASYSMNSLDNTGQKMGTVITPPNENLRWERTQSTNLGFDFSVLNNRMMGSIDIYNKYSDDLLASTSIDPTYGFSSAMLNIGAMRNRGIELDLRGTIIQTKDLLWSAGFTTAYNNNKVVKLYYEPKTASDLYQDGNAVQGRPYKSMYSFRFVRIDDKGEAVILDENGKESTITKVTSVDAVEYSGTLTPLFNGALYSTVGYKGFELSFNFIYSAGNVMRKLVTNPNITTINNLSNGNYENRWQQPGDELKQGVTPRITFSTFEKDATNRNDQWRYSNTQVVSANYVKLRSLTASYNFARVIKRGFLKNLTLRTQVDNLFYLAANKDGSDPENYNYNSGERYTPQMPTYYIGAKIAF